MTLSIRPALTSDLAFVSQDGYITPAVAHRKIQAEEVFLAEKNGTPRGYLRLEYLWSTEPYIALIHVLEPHRRQGIGRSLLSYVEEKLRADGHTTLYSSSQADEAQPQAWHRHMGFIECGMIAGLNEGGVGEIFFRKIL